MIHSSLGEGCSNAILEANAAGLIVVASNTGGTHEIINEWDFLFEYKNSQDLNKKLNEAIELNAHNEPVREKIQNTTKNKFSIESFIKNYSNVVEKNYYG